MSKLFIVYRADRADGQAAAICEAIQDMRMRGASVGPAASAASTAMTPPTTTGEIA